MSQGSWVIHPYSSRSKADPRSSQLDGLEILETVFQSHGGLPASATAQRGLRCAIELPLTDRHRRDKVDILLRGVKPQQALDDALIQEIKSATMAASNHDLGVIHVCNLPYLVPRNRFAIVNPAFL
jgi:hypothetical protein